MHDIIWTLCTRLLQPCRTRTSGLAGLHIRSGRRDQLPLVYRRRKCDHGSSNGSSHHPISGKRSSQGNQAGNKGRKESRPEGDRKSRQECHRESGKESSEEKTGERSRKRSNRKRCRKGSERSRRESYREDGEATEKSAERTAKEAVDKGAKGGSKDEILSTSKRQTPDQNALHRLAKEAEKNAKKGNPISYEKAKILDEWAREYNVPQHHTAEVGSGQHFPGGNYMDHTHIYNIHIPYEYR